LKIYNALISAVLVLCLGAAYATGSPVNCGSDGGQHASSATYVGQSVAINSNASSSDATAAVNMNASVSNAVSFTPITTNGSCIDNTQKVAVYMAAMTNRMYSESAGKETTVAVTYDPLTTAMLFEYNPDYLGDSDIENKLTTANYSILIVPMSQMSDTAATQINSYIASGGSVWFLNDPRLTPTGCTSANRITILGTSVSVPVSNSTTITVVNTDNITNGLSMSFKPVGTSSKTTYMRSLNGSGTISGLNYQVLMSSSTNALLIKYENSTNGARVIYSNPNMFVSGGSASYFNAQTATQLFLQTKAWIMKLAQNPNGVEITYPKGDKQFIVTTDDVEAAEWETHTMDTMFNVEKKAGVTPSAVNTFFIIPSIENTITSELTYYAQNGDIHTLHPHVDINTYLNYFWDKTGTSVATYQATINADRALINKLMNTSDYGFTAWRFPYTTFCTNSMQAVSNSGFTIDSSSGIGSHGIQIGDPVDNTVLFPKQLLVNNEKSNLIEMEIAAPFDIDCVIPGTTIMSPTVFYNKYNNSTTQFKNGNFPMNFVVICHIQGAGTDAGMASGLGKIIKSEQTANPNYANFNTLANYINGIKSAKITASVSGSTTTVTVVNTKPITDFTMKVAIGKVTSAKYDGTPIPSSQIKQDAITSSWYVTQTVDAGTHVFVITTA
jgi:hypothetical protein